MTQRNLSALMARVAEALRRPGNPFRVDARPFGDGWAAFVDADFDTKWLETNGRGATEEAACAAAWIGVRIALHDEHARRVKQREEHLAAAGRAEHDCDLYAAALAVEP